MLLIRFCYTAAICEFVSRVEIKNEGGGPWGEHCFFVVSSLAKAPKGQGKKGQKSEHKGQRVKRGKKGEEGQG